MENHATGAPNRPRRSKGVEGDDSRARDSPTLPRAGRGGNRRSRGRSRRQWRNTGTLLNNYNVFTSFASEKLKNGVALSAFNHAVIGLFSRCEEERAGFPTKHRPRPGRIAGIGFHGFERDAAEH